VTGAGQHLDVALGQASVYANEWAAATLQDPVDSYGHFETWNHYTYRLGDGSFVALVGSPVDCFPMWVDCLSDSQDLLTDPRFATREARASHVEDLVDAVDGLTSRFANFAALEPVLGPRVLAAPVRSLSDLSATDWAAYRELTVEVTPGLPVPAAPWQASGATIGVQPTIAALGADNRSVLAACGYRPDEIDALQSSGALRSNPTGAPVPAKSAPTG
jgi:crotonobetainyl-CoA:carnitine CoA-transferase CaiB-like acyl-CoA transferase